MLAVDLGTAPDWSAEDRETARDWVSAAEVRRGAETALVALAVAASSTFDRCTIDTAE
jgi:hypothetical protein